MALQLNAEQKYILKIFGDKTKYIIPPYQRAYTWTESECEELFEDLKTAFQKNKSEGYFIGNLVLATSARDEFEVIDGQQRLTTLIMLLKVLWAFDAKNRKLKNTIWILDDRTDAIIEQRVITNIFIERDSLSFNEVLDENYQYEKPQNKKDKFKTNIYFFYEKIKDFIDQDGNDIKDFIDFILYDVSLLPIFTEAENTAKAREKALKIFETMNNRGMPLDDSDIFKSNLYYMANRHNEQDTFVELWKSFDERCEAIDDKLKLRAFKIYSYMTRGEQGIKSSEIGLRDFFEKTEYSPFKKKTYREILDDLNRIVDSVEYFEETKQQSDNELAKWFQLIDLYTNAYPKDTVIVYLVKNNLNVGSDNTTKFAKSLVRQSYAKGSTTYIKHDMYDLVIKIMHEKWEVFYDKNYTCPYGFGRLYRGFELLEKYLDSNQLSVYPYKLKRRMYDMPGKATRELYERFFRGEQ
ncbi:Protein of unknown function DUF262 [Sulfurimonas denitrificans DSM 1251]|uniref:GmrSD restriction endonucleases N-terminal domain-containing protein n=1 Tax=Sulfurimonas denitrificans (strain ATCC 33889 / DSM 1251) TaxID=326298 RepID=Q30Q66_SULDN|nr:DUF262 domain-containing protein [Sulfurimonas denitrificans]ABB43970.1 Protein of unknown function DUF262 [Sulfurimonas denitrificans DSM 1251]ABB44865.1 Protein of unknown function DUF262 [Sulfurimonas denitrificans DSM 1251]